MRLKRLEILGFKSFADKTKLEFDPGITAVVGPNGCGKSNISDAFRWVLGEQSAKSLRGSKMPDIIFAGTSQRKPLNFAEVTLTLSDINGKLPIEYDEIAVTRRLHRNGESEYLINKHPVRLKDVQTLFLDSGMGKDAYSIFEQGKIDQVINLSPLERRYIFEETAGILRFLQRKKEALRKLEQTELNVSRIKDIHQEVERQIIVLEEQSEKALHFKSNKTHLDMLEKSFIVAKWEAMNKKIKEVKIKKNEQEKYIGEINTQIDLFQKDLLQSKIELFEAEKMLKIKSEHIFNVRTNKELQFKEKQTNQERLKELNIKEKRWKAELEKIIERRQHRENERKQMQKILKESSKCSNDLDELVKCQKEKVNLVEEELFKEREQQQSKQKDLFKLMQEESHCESEIRQLNVRLENALERLERLSERKERSSQISTELLAHINERKKQLQEACENIEKQKIIFVSMENNLHEIADNISKMEEELNAILPRLADLKARQKVLLFLKQDLEGFSVGSKKILQESANQKSELFSKIKGLYEYLIPEKGEEDVLASAMKPYAQTLVVETQKDFSLVLDFIKNHQIKDVSLICLDLVVRYTSQNSSNAIDTFSPLVTTKTGNPLVKHFLKDIFLNKKSLNPIELIKKYAGIQMCLAEGVFIDQRSVIFFSSAGENNIFLREAELKMLEKTLHEIEIEKKKIETCLQSLQVKREKIQSERVELDKVIRKAEMKMVELNFSIQKSSSDLEKNIAEDKLLANDWQLVKTSIETFTLSLIELKERHQHSKERVKQAQIITDHLTAELIKLVENAKKQNVDLQHKEHSLNIAAEELSKYTHALHVLEIKDLESVQQENRLQEEIELGYGSKDQLELNDSEVEKKLEHVENALKDALIASQQFEVQVVLRKKALEQLEAQIQDKHTILKKHENESNQSNILLAQLEGIIQTLEGELLERHQMPLNEALNIIDFAGKSIEEMEQQIRQLRQVINHAGDINMNSIEECEKHKVRYQFLNQQIDDLKLSKNELVEIISELDGESRKIFLDTFQKIKINFKKNFEILFNGGEADLHFTDSEDVLDAGIEIIAKPPGKHMRSINLLSGGEKCLTAMALLFAIFEVKPAPFCILDEIDAPLDDTNVERFVNLVKEFVEKCQFIIITHNKHTMAIADVICGVSMEEKGVSKLLSIDFSKNTMPEMASI